MSLGRLEIRQSEETVYFCPNLKADVTVEFRHATDGDIARTLKRGGVVLRGNKLVEEEDANQIDQMVSMYDALVELGKRCSIRARTEQASIDLGEVDEEIFYMIGAYVNKEARLTKTEGEGSALQPTGSTPAG